MASVWRAEHPDLGTVKAIKIMAPELAVNKDMVGRFMDEARIQVSLKHPNIVNVENLCREPPAMVLELVQGRPMSEVIGTEVGPIPFARAWPMMKQIMDAVAYAHGKGVVHRDIKPSNMLVTAEDAVKVMDFGIAKVLGTGGRTRTGATLGTPAYMAPEQIKGAKDVDERSDIYALGVTFYEIQAGRTPFEMNKGTDSEFELMEAQVHRDPPDPRQFYPAIPEEAVGALFRSLAKLPEHRFQSIEEMRAAWEQVSMTAQGAPRPLVEDVQAEQNPPLPVMGSAADSGVPQQLAQSVPAPATTPASSQGSSRTVWIAGGVAVGAVAVVALLVVLLMGRSGGKNPELSNSSTEEQTSEATEPEEDAEEEEPKLPTAAEVSTLSQGTELIKDELRTPASHVVTFARALYDKFGPGEEARRQCAGAVNTRGVHLFKVGKANQALKLHKAAAEMDYTYGLPRFNVAKIYAIKGDVENCVKYLQQLKDMQTDPRLDPAQQKYQAKPLKWALESPKFSEVRDDPRFQAIYR